MCAKWNDKFNPEIIATKLNKIKHFNATGSFSGLEAFQAQDYLAVLKSSLDFSEQIGWAERSRIINSVVVDLSRKDSLTAKTILGAVCKAENLSLARPKLNFVFATSFSIPFSSDLQNRVVRGSRVIFSNQLPKKFRQEPLAELRQRFGITDIPASYCKVRVSISARDHIEAIPIALEKLDLIRGKWNLALNDSWVLSLGNSRRESVNKITLGPFHSLHLPSGKLTTTDILWYEPDYSDNHHHGRKELERLLKFEKRIDKDLTRHPYRRELEDIIVRYVRALDFADLHVAFLQLWGVLERLTNTNKADNETTIKRTAFHYEEEDMHMQVLQHLRKFRNANVHSGFQTQQIKTLLHQLMRYVEKLIFFHVANIFKFTSLDVAAAFADLPVEPEKLKAKIAGYKSALKFRTRRTK